MDNGQWTMDNRLLFQSGAVPELQYILGPESSGGTVETQPIHSNHLSMPLHSLVPC